jgi:catechol 2,3-dioxygenase-like lactoylglutathione lyase family enzyme
MIDHVELCVGDIAKATAFYVRALAPIGYVVRSAANPSADSVGFGTAPDRLDFWLRRSDAPSAPRPHFAFGCATRDEVVRAHAAALGAGGEDCGAPALLAHLHPAYYAAFVRDPDGHKVEFVCQRPIEGSSFA